MAFLGILQLIIRSDATNLYCIFILLTSAAVVIFTMIRGTVLKQYPISAFQVLAFWMATQGLAIIAMTLEWKGVSENMDNPIRVFLIVSFAGFALIGAHCVCRIQPIQRIREWVSLRINARLRLFRTPEVPQVWLIGSIGLMAMLVERVLSHGSSDPMTPAAGGGVLSKFVDGLMVYGTAPFLLPFLAAIQRKTQRIEPRDFLLQAIFFLVYAGIGIAANVRTTVVMPLVTVFCAACLLVATGQLKPTAFRSKLWIGLGIIAFFGVGTAADFAVAMQAAREQRGKISPTQMLALSMEIYSSPQMMGEYKRSIKMQEHMTSWNETYTSNIFLNRFLTIKFHDLGLGLEEKLTDRKRQMLADFNNVRILAIYPAPIVNLLPFGIKKSSLSIVSCGDMMFFLVTGTGLGGFRTGSPLAEGLGLWGIWFYPVLAITAIFIFILSDSFVLTVPLQERIKSNPALSAVSFAILISVYPVFNLFQADAYDVYLNFLLRGFWQGVLMYALLFWITSRVGGLFTRK